MTQWARHRTRGNKETLLVPTLPCELFPGNATVATRDTPTSSGLSGQLTDENVVNAVEP